MKTDTNSVNTNTAPSKLNTIKNTELPFALKSRGCKPAPVADIADHITSTHPSWETI